MIKVKCKYCGKEKNIPNYREKRFKYCSRKCKDLDMKGHKPWNKDLKYSDVLKSKLNTKGLDIGRKSRKGKIFVESYMNIHYWARQNKKGEKVCVDCGKKEGIFHLSNIDHKYRKNLDDYSYRCIQCHRHHDKYLPKRKSNS